MSAEEELPASKARLRGSKRRSLSSLMILIGIKKIEKATRSGDAKEDGVRGDKTERVELEVDGEEVAVVSEEQKMEYSRKLGTKKTKEMEAEISKEVERDTIEGRHC